MMYLFDVVEFKLRAIVVYVSFGFYEASNKSC